MRGNLNDPTPVAYVADYVKGIEGGTAYRQRTGKAAAVEHIFESQSDMPTPGEVHFWRGWLRGALN